MDEYDEMILSYLPVLSDPRTLSDLSIDELWERQEAGLELHLDGQVYVPKQTNTTYEDFWNLVESAKRNPEKRADVFAHVRHLASVRDTDAFQRLWPVQKISAYVFSQVLAHEAYEELKERGEITPEAIEARMRRKHGPR